MGNIIGLMGAKGAGKDTCANYLVEELGYVRTSFAEALYKEVAVAFNVSVDFLSNRETKESPLKELALENCTDSLFQKVILQLESDEICKKSSWTKLLFKLRPKQMHLRILKQARSPRFILQRWGTEYKRRMFADDYWMAIVNSMLLDNPEKNFVITDVRFPNEVKFVKKRGGYLWRVTRPFIEEQIVKEREAGGAASHPSETELISQPCDVEIINHENDQAGMRAQALKHAASRNLITLS